MNLMSSDYHDVPHCIRQALAATSPAPTHYSRISESPSHDEAGWRPLLHHASSLVCSVDVTNPKCLSSAMSLCLELDCKDIVALCTVSGTLSS